MCQGKREKFPCQVNEGKNISYRLLENIQNWNDLGLVTNLRSIDEIDTWFVDEDYEWAFYFDGKQKENAFGNCDWSEF